MSRKATTTERLSVKILKDYIGGSSLGCKILYDEVPPETNPYDPGNKLIIATDPLSEVIDNPLIEEKR